MARRKTTPEDDIRALQPGEKPYSHAVGKGLSLLVQPNGAKWWRFRYNHNGKPKMLSCGTFPDVSLEMAEAKRDELRRMVASGTDPAKIRKHEKQATRTAGENTFRAVAELWQQGANRRALNEKTIYNIRRRLELDVYPMIGTIPMAELAPNDIRSVIQKAKARGVLDTALRIGRIIAEVCNHATVQGIIETNPAIQVQVAKLVDKPAASHHAAPTEPEEVGAILRQIYAYRGTAVVQYALKIGINVFVRPGELRKMEWCEIDWKQKKWSIPAGKMKKCRGEPVGHLVPLSQQVITMLKELQDITGEGRYVFPSQRGQARPMSDNALNTALRAMSIANTELVAHGFRAIARTLLDEQLKFRPDFIEHQLAHAVRDPNGRAYNRTKHWEERTAMMQTWSDYLDALRLGGNVTAIGSKVAA